MKAPLSQNFKLSQQPTYKRSVLEDSSSIGLQRDIKQRIPLSASSRGGAGQVSSDQDMFQRKMGPDNSQHLGGTFQNQDPYNRKGIPQTSYNQNYRSIQQPSPNGNYRSPSAGYQGFQTSTSQHYERNNNDFLQTQSSRDGGFTDSHVIKMSGGGYYPKAQVNNTQQHTAEKYGFSSDRYSIERPQANFSNIRSSQNTNNRDYMLSHSVDQQYQPIMADHSPQIANRVQPSGVIRDFNPSSYYDNDRKSTIDPYITSQRDKFNNNQRQQNLMDNQNSQGPSYSKHNRLLSNESQHNQNIQEQQQPVEIEQAVLNLRSKVKNLESKYIDLANFYKKELVNQTHNQISYQGNKSPFRQGEYMDSQSRYYNTSLDNDRSRSPIRSSIEPRIDQNTEKELINDLLSEKKDLENEISTIVECLQKIQEENDINHDKIVQLDNEKKQLQQKSNGQAPSQESIAQVKNQVQQILDNFEGEFLDFINQNYQSFTENDVLGLFGNLRAQIKQMVDSIKFDKKDSGREPFSQIQSNEQIQFFDQQRQQLMGEYQKDLNEFELNNEYTLQKIKQTTFELQNKHDITKLDLKKALLTLSNLQKTSGELQSLTNSTQSSFERPGSTGYSKSNKTSGGILDMRTSNLNQPSTPQNQQLVQVVNEIVNQVGSLSQAMSNMSKKLNSSDKDLKQLSDIEKENVENMKQLRDSFDRLLSEIEQPRINLHVEKEIENNQTFHLNELKVMNDKLQREIQLSADKFTSLKLENQHLLTQIDNKRSQDKFVITSPSFNNNQRQSREQRHLQASPPYENEVFQQQQQRLSLLESENYNLTKQIKSLSRQLEEKSQQLEKISSDFITSPKAFQPTNQAVSLDQVLFHQEQHDKQIEKTRNLLKLTQKFLYSMKKLQKAVHRKEINVQKEKADFESTRKDLESVLKQLKREFEQLDNAQNAVGGVRASSIGRISNDDQPNIQSKLNKYQSNNPNTFQQQNRKASITKKQNSQSYNTNQQQQLQPMNASQMYKNQINPYSVNQSLGVSSIMNENHNSTLRDKSPIPLRSKFTSARNGLNDQFHSIEPYERRGRDPLLSSLERPSQQRSPSVNAYDNYHQISLDQSQPQLQSAIQINNMKNEIDLLHQEIKDLLNEREMLNNRIMRVEQDKDALSMDLQLIEKQLDREAKKSESTRREMIDLELEKETLLNEYKRLRTQFQPESLNDKDLQVAQEQNEQMFEQVQILERINNEQRRTIEFLEESAEAAKNTITELKEAISQKDLEIVELQKDLDNKSLNNRESILTQNNIKNINEGEFRKLKTQLLEKVEEIEQENDIKFQQLESDLKGKEHEISKLKRQLDRKIKEKEIQLQQQQQFMQSQNSAEPQLSQRISDLESMINEKERLIKQYEEKKLEQIVSAQEKNVLKLEKLNKDLQQQINDLHGSMGSQTQQLKKEIEIREEERNKLIGQIQKEKENYEKIINKLKSDHNTQLQTLQQNEQENFENQISEIQHQNQIEMQNLIRENQQQQKEQQHQLKTEFDKKIKQLTEQHNKQIQDLQSEMDRKIQEERNLAVELQTKDQQENLKRIQDADKKKWESERTKLESVLKQEKQKVVDKDSEIEQLRIDYDLQIDELNEQLEIQQSESQKAQQQKDAFINQLKQQALQQKSDLESQLDELQRQYENEKQELEEEIEQEKVKVNDIKKEKENAIGQKDKEIQNLRSQELRNKDQFSTDLQKKQNEIEELQESIQELEDTIHQTQSEGTSQVTSLQKQVENQKQLIKQKEQEIKDLNEQIQEDQQAIDDLNSQNTDLQSQLDSQLSTNKQIQNELNNEKQKSQKSMQELQGKNEKLAKEKESLREQLEKLELQEQNLQGQLQVAQNQIEELKKNQTQSQSKLKDVSTQLSDQQAKYKALLIERDGLSNDMETYQQSQQQLSEQLEKEQQLKDQLSQKIAEMIKQSQLKQGQLERDLNNKINELTQQNEELKEANERLEQQIEVDKSQYESKLSQINSQLSTLNQDADKKNNIINEKEKEIKNLKQQLVDNESESKYAVQIRQSIQQQLEKLQKETSDKDAQLGTIQTQLTSQLQDKETTVQEQEDVILDLQQQINELKSQIEQIKQEKSKIEKNFEHEIQELNKKLQNAQNDKESVKHELDQKLKFKDQHISELQSEKQSAQDSLKDMINQTKFEKQSLQEQLQIQLTNTLAQLQQKEQDLIQKDQELQQVDQQLREVIARDQENSQRVKELEDENEQYIEEIQALEEQRGKHQQTLENNRNLIQMLKNELQKSIDKQKQSEKEKELTDTEKDKEHNTKLQQLQQQIGDLRNNYEDQIMDLKLQIDTLEQDQRQKQELIDEADRAIQDYYDDKNEIRAKFKHLQQLLEGIEDESSYKEDDDVDLEKCFDLFEKEFLKNRRKVESKIESLEKENSMLKQQVFLSKSELDQMEGKMIEIQLELTKAVQKQETNDGEMRKQIEVAQRKYQNYKDKLIEKQKQLNQLEIEKRQREESQVQSREPSVVRENLELLQKLQKAENELQNYRLSNQRGGAGGRIGGTPTDISQDESFKVDAQRIKQIEDQLINLRKQLFQAKDQVIDQMTELFARRIKELTNTYQKDHILKGKLSEMKTDAQIQGLNNNIKMIKQVNVFNKKLLIIQVVNNSECYVIDEAKLSETSSLYLKSYMPVSESELNESFLQIDEKQQQLVDKLESQMKEIREERQELQQELQVYKSKLFGGQAFEDMKELKMIELEDELGHINEENIELRQKMKEVISKNTLLQIRVIELNEIIRDLTSKTDPDSANRKLIKLKEDNESLRQELVKQQAKKKQSIHPKSQQRFNQDGDDDFEEGSFLEGIKVADNMMNTSQNDNNNNNLFDQSSLYDVIGEMEEEKTNKVQLTQTVEKLKYQVEELQNKNKTLQSEVQKSQQSLNPNEMSVINHIKGTLVQFLKNCPLTDKNNEGLLTVIFSIMEFQKEDVEEIQEYRKKGGSQQRGNSVSSGHVNTEEDIKKKTGKGILGKMFKKKEKESSVQRQPPFQDDPNIFSPIRPIKRN